MTDLTPEQTNELLISAVKAVVPYLSGITDGEILRIADVVRTHDAIHPPTVEAMLRAEVVARVRHRPLGHLQLMALDMLNRRGPFPGGWTIDNTSSTVRILDSLVKNGFATVETSERAVSRGMIGKRYSITPAGRVALAVATPTDDPKD